MRYFLGPWVWRDLQEFPHWSAPDGCEPVLDLRTVPQAALAGKVEGFGLFVAPDAVQPSSEWEDLGTDPEVATSEKAKRKLEGAIKLPRKLEAKGLYDSLWEILTTMSDPTGEDRAKPIVPTTQRFYELWIGGARVRSLKFRGTEPEAAPVLDMLKREYREHRAAVYDQKLPPEHHRRVLDYWCHKYRLDYHAFQPADVPDEKPLKHETTVSDDFNRANGSIGANWTAASGTASNVSITSNECVANVQHTVLRHVTPVSSVDHYAQVNGYRNGNAYGYQASARHLSSAHTRYFVRCTATTGTLEKAVSGVETNLSSWSRTVGATDYHTIKVLCSGTTLEAYFDGALDRSITDSAISGNLYGGFYIGGTAHADDFLFEDLAAGGQPTMRRLGRQPIGMEGVRIY